MVKPIRSSSSARAGRHEPVVYRLRRDILLGRHAVGQRLPPERELAVRLNTNRNTLREALRVLEAEKLVRARQGDGTVVLDWRTGGEIALLPAFLAEDTPADERFDALLALINLHERLMDEALGMATAHATDEDLDAVQTALNALADARPGLEVVAADLEVARRIVLGAHSLVLIWVFNTFAAIFRQLGERFPGMWTNHARYREGLAQVLRWLGERRADRAREEMHHVLEDRGMALLENLRPAAAIADERRGRKKRGPR
jgi:DNA-binding FadR family transcriptional regulator